MEREALDRLADLAKLRLSPEQHARATQRLERLLDAFAVLEQVPTDDVEASPYPLPIPHRLRPDAAEPGLTQDDVLGGAPEVRGGCFRVPRVVEG